MLLRIPDLHYLTFLLVDQLINKINLQLFSLPIDHFSNLLCNIAKYLMLPCFSNVRLSLFSFEFGFCTVAQIQKCCKLFLYLVVLWLFAAHMLSNWGRSLLNLLVHFLICSAMSSFGHRAKGVSVLYNA